MPRGLMRWFWLVGLLAGRWAAAQAPPPAAPPSAPPSSLAERVDAITNAREFAGAHWGLLVVDLATGRPIFERNPDQLFCPASVTKLFTTAAALADLGAEYRFKTPVVRRGEVKDGTLQGDLILVARGDLCLGGRTGPDGSLLFEDGDHSYGNGTLVPCDPLAGLIHLAREVHSSGIRAVAGDVIVDDRLFEAAPSTGSGPARVSPIVVNDNIIDVVVTPGPKAGEPARVRFVPETAFASADVRVETTPEGAGAASIQVRAVGPRRFTVRGKIPVGNKPVNDTYEVDEPAAFARALFIETLRARGIAVLAASPLGENLAAPLPPRAEVAALPAAAEYTSPPLREYVRVILKVSQNLHASTLPLILAASHGETTLNRGLRFEAEALAKLGVDTGALSFGGGAGGDRADLATPRATVALLRAMAARPDFAAYDNALPVLGRDGTLAKAVPPESPARGHAHAKTGSYWVNNPLTGHAVLTSKALAGYLETASGRRLAFAFYVNQAPSQAIAPTVGEASQVAGRRLGKLCEVFYGDAEPPAPAEASPPAPPAAESVKTGR